MGLLKWPAATLALALAAGRASADGTVEERLTRLEKAAALNPVDAGTIEGAGKVGVWWNDGLKFKAQDFEGRVGAYVITHWTNHTHRNDTDGKFDTFSIREAGIDMQARMMGAWEVFLRARVAPGGTDLYYGWVEFNKCENIKVRAGLFKEPFSGETLEDVKWMDMCENSLLSVLTPNRDLGVMIHGNVCSGVFNYNVGVFNGNGVGGDENSDKDAAGRLVFRPGANSESDAIKHLSIAVHGTWGNANRQVSDGPFRPVAPATGTRWNQEGTVPVEMDGRVARAGGEVMYACGPIEIKTEFVSFRSVVDDNDGSKQAYRAHAWYFQAAFWLWGSRSPGKRPVVDKPLFGDKGGIGAFQIVGRYSTLRANNVLRTEYGFTGSSTAKEYAICVNWYPCANARISAMFVHYQYDSRKSHNVAYANGNIDDDENAVILRAQVDF